jgi:hypothetical protein
MSARTIGDRLFTDGATRPVYEDECGQYIEEDGELVDGAWLVPEEDGADAPVIVASQRCTLAAGPGLKPSWRCLEPCRMTSWRGVWGAPKRRLC